MIFAQGCLGQSYKGYYVQLKLKGSYLGLMVTYMAILKGGKRKKKGKKKSSFV